MITLFTDASFCRSTKAAGYGAWIKVDGWGEGHFYGGIIKSASSTNEAELMGLGNAISHASKMGWLDGQDYIMIQMDSASAIGAIHTMSKDGFRVVYKKSSSKQDLAYHQNRTFISDGEKRVLDFLRSKLSNFLVATRHVKGHSNKRGGRSYVNQTCDRIARINFTKQRELLRGTKRTSESSLL